MPLGGGKHQYWACRDADCPRYPCVAYKHGFADGYEQGAAAAAGDE